LSRKTVVRDLPVKRLREYVLLRAFHPVFAIEFLRNGVAILQDLPLLVREIEIHAFTPCAAIPSCRGSTGINL
jgi:hypothetical protein